MRYTTSDGVSITYEVYGRGKDLVLLHGALVDRAYWQPQLAELSQYYRLIIPDFRWNTLDAPIDYSVERMAQDTLELLNHIGTKSIHICGHALGGSVAVHLATIAPQYVDKIILLETLPEYPFQGIFLQLLKATAFLTPIGMLARSMRNLTDDEDLKAYIVEQVKLLGKEKYFKLLQSQVEYEFQTILEHIQHSTLLLWGASNSRFSKATMRMVNQMPNAYIRIIPRAGHMANWDNTSAFNQAVIDHLSIDETLPTFFRPVANANQ